MEMAAGSDFMDFTLYWFMLPVATMVATTAALSGIGGAALFTPIFIIVFPLLGPEYPLESTVAAIGAALLTGTFGFGSGFIGYYRKGLIDFSLAVRFMKISVPVAIAGALISHLIDGAFLMMGYAALVFVLALVLIFSTRTNTGKILAGKKINRTDKSGRVFEYVLPELGIFGVGITSIGAFLTGLLSVGIGEVVVPQLTKRGVPVPVAAATSVAVVIATVAAASFTVIGQLIRGGGLSAVPWDLVAYTIPGVILGGQIGPRLQGRVPQRVMERGIGLLFIIIAFAMSVIVLKR